LPHDTFRWGALPRCVLDAGVYRGRGLNEIAPGVDNVLPVVVRFPSPARLSAPIRLVPILGLAGFSAPVMPIWLFGVHRLHSIAPTFVDISPI
jgi:hypothetical protein